MMRVFSVVMRRASAMTPLSDMPAAASAARSARPASSVPSDAEGSDACAQRRDIRGDIASAAQARRFGDEVHHGTAASGESRVAVPQT